MNNELYYNTSSINVFRTPPTESHVKYQRSKQAPSWNLEFVRQLTDCNLELLTSSYTLYNVLPPFNAESHFTGYSSNSAAINCNYIAYNIIKPSAKSQNPLKKAKNTIKKTVFASMKTVFTSSKTLFASMKTVFASSKIIFTSSKTIFTSMKIVFASSKIVFTSSKTVFASMKTVFASGKTLFTSSKTLLAEAKMDGVNMNPIIMQSF